MNNVYVVEKLYSGDVIGYFDTREQAERFVERNERFYNHKLYVYVVEVYKKAEDLETDEGIENEE